jgi:Protein of unknown function (DUF3551)
MKTIAAGLLVVPFLVPLVSSPAAAQANRPWCAQYYGFGGATNCGFTSYQQCMIDGGTGHRRLVRAQSALSGVPVLPPAPLALRRPARIGVRSCACALPMR